MRATGDYIFAEAAGSWSVYDYNFGGNQLKGPPVEEPWISPQLLQSLVIPIAILAVIGYQYFFGVWSGKNKDKDTDFGKGGRRKPNEADIHRKLDEIQGKGRVDGIPKSRGG